MRKLTIKNSEWLRGTEDDWERYRPCLYDKDCYCVQGLYLQQNGIPAGQLIDCDIVSDVDDPRINLQSEVFGWLVVESDYGVLLSSTTAHQIALINDNTETSDAEKIDLLRPIFAAHGVEIEYREDL